MQSGKFINRVLSVPLTIAIFSIVSCATQPDVTGRWRETGKSATLEFHNDGTFKAVDNEGMAVSGTYVIREDGNIKFEIALQGSLSEVVQGKYTVRGDELTLLFRDPNGTERYKREK